MCVPSHLSCVRLFVTLWTVARSRGAQAPLSFSLSYLLRWQVGSLPPGPPGKPEYLITKV